MAELTRLAAAGKSAAEIGRLMGCSRNAVIGAAFRVASKVRLSGQPKPKAFTRRPVGGRGWPDKTALIALALKAGGKSHEEIAGELNVGVNAVAKLSRAMGLGRRGRQPQRQIEDARLRARITVRLRRQAAGGDFPVQGFRAESFQPGYMGQQGRIAIEDLEAHHCRFPIDMPSGEVRYCGETVEEHGRYCAAHAARCFAAPVKLTPRKGKGFALRNMNHGGWQ